MSDYDEAEKIKQKVAYLASQRDRTGKSPLKVEERLQLLFEIYDGALYWLAQCVVTGTAKGTMAVGQILDRARLEIESWGGKERSKTEFVVSLDKLSENELETLHGALSKMIPGLDVDAGSSRSTEVN